MNQVHISTIRAQARGHFFSPATTKFFRSRYPSYGYQAGDKIYFATSEQFDRNSPRRYSVRVLDCISGNVDTVGKFQEYQTWPQANRAATRLAMGESAVIA